jgi:putative tryptophan/tyrosine transport system substrate-binding protein
MRRREFITLLGGAAAAWPLAARAQQDGRMPRVAVLTPYAESDPEGQARLAALREGLQKLGWAEGRNIQIDNRWGALDAESMRFAKELVAQQPDLILTQSTPTTAAILQQTRTIPVLFVQVTDPVGQGIVASLVRPGGNTTGFTNFEPSLAGKWLELLTEIAPRVARIAFLFNPETAPFAEIYLNPFRAAASSFRVEAIAAPVHDTSELEPVVAAHARAPNGGLVVAPDICTSIAPRSHRWLPATVSLPSIRSVSTLNSAAFCPTEMTRSTPFVARRRMSIVSYAARSRASFPSSSQSSSK